MLSRYVLVKKLFLFLEEIGVDYCVVGNPKNILNVKGDIDIIIGKKFVFDIRSNLNRFCIKNGAQLIQVFQHEQTAWFFIIAWLDETGSVSFLHPDICSDYFRNGKCFLSADEMIASRVKSNEISECFIPSAAKGFIYYLIKKIDKGHFSTLHGNYLSLVWKKDPGGCKKEIERFWPKEKISQIILAAESNNWYQIRTNIPLYKIELHKSITLSFNHKFLELFRKLNRFFQPTGLLIAFLGPDGSGKSSVIKKIIPELAPAFRRTQYIHLRPHLGKKIMRNNMPVDDPHGKKPRSWTVSFAKILYFLFDYSMGYLLKVRPLLVRSTFVVFDRYYYDILIDPKRYRYGGSTWLSNVVGKFVPKPDLIFLLDAPAEVLQDRKQEVTLEESFRQRDAYVNFINELDNGVVINSNQELDRVVYDVNKSIIHYLAQRVKYSE